MKILVMGEINVDLILEGYESFPESGKEVLVRDFSMVLGSSSAICAVGLSRLGNEVSYLGVVGEDQYGDFCLGVLRRERIDVSRVRRDPSVKTGVTVSITRGTHRALVTFLGSIAALDGSTIPPEMFRGFDHLHGSSYFLQPKLQPRLPLLFEQAHQAGAATSLDTGFDPSEQWDSGLPSTLAQTDVFLPNEIEAAAISGSSDPEEGVRRLNVGRTRTVIKLGAEGAIAMEDGRILRAQPFPVVPLDTTGAGDSFNAGFLHAWLRKRPLAEALRFASACGALSTQALGGIGGQPTVEEVERFLALHS